MQGRKGQEIEPIGIRSHERFLLITELSEKFQFMTVAHTLSLQLSNRERSKEKWGCER